MGLAGRFRWSQRSAAGGRKNTARPGPGAETVFGTGGVEILDHVARLQGSVKTLSYAPCALSPSGPGAELARHTSGKAIVAYLGFSDAGLADPNTQHSVGWISSDYVFGHVQAQIGLGIGDPSHGGHPRDIRIQQRQNDGKGTVDGVIFKNVLRSGDCLGVAVVLTESGYTVYIQGALAEQWGCILGSNNWFPIFTSTKKLTGKLTGLVVSRDGVPLYVSRFGQMTQFRNDATSTWPIAGPSRSARYIKHLFVPTPPAACGWAGMPRRRRWERTWTVSSRAAPNGSWSSKYVVVPGGNDETILRHFGSISVVNGEIWYTYVRTADKYKTTTKHYVVLKADASNNITWDAEHTIAVPSSNGTFASHAYTLPSGRVLLPMYSGEPYSQWWAIYSDDHGATWKESAHKRGGDEATFAREPSGQLVIFIRPETPNYVLRSTSSDDGASWSEPKPTTIWNPCCRFQARDLPDGNVLLVGNENPGEFNYCLRPKVTAWILGNNARVLRKIPLADYGPTAYNPAARMPATELS